MDIRAARVDDLAAMYIVYYLNEILEARDAGDAGKEPAASPDIVTAMLRHIFETGKMSVAEQDGRIIAFTGAVTRGPITFLTDLFVRPESHSGGLGQSLLRHVLPQDGSIRCTVSSTDPRAQALYTRLGMQPLFPHFNLRWQGEAGREPLSLPSGLEVVEGRAGDPEFMRWDSEISGRARPVDHAFWLKEDQAVPLWFRRRGVRVGYAYVRTVAKNLLSPRKTVVGPLGVSAPEYATECVLAAAGWAQQRADMVRIDLPGPHPALAALLERGFQIIYVETFHSSAAQPFFDVRCYVPSGSDLF